ncbi:MAG: carbohydrate ABC transporter permease [Gorillibacterium sp.]|nr:carbohydrate ABC transporter permease [Gorillibacterium sp.]
MKSKVKHKRKKLQAFDWLVLVILGVWALIIIYPFYNSILVSVVNQAEYTRTPFLLFPKHFTTINYQFVFQSNAIWNGLKISVITVVLGLLYSMFLTVTIAYPLSKKSFPGKALFLNMIILTMFFGGGLIPFYLLIKNLGMVNSISSLIIPAGVNTFYMLIVRNYFMSLPEELEESAKIDGASDPTILWKIILPISLPVIVTVGLFYSVDKWNDWFNAVLFIKDGAKLPVQTVLRNIISNTQVKSSTGVPPAMQKEAFDDGVKMASILITMFPVMCVYPFVQKYFMKGIMLGALKG